MTQLKLKKNYRCAAFDPLNDIYILEKRFCFFFWLPISVGTKEKVQRFLENESILEENKNLKD